MAAAAKSTDYERNRNKPFGVAAAFDENCPDLRKTKGPGIAGTL